MPKEKKEIPWAKSQAKKLLTAQIMTGDVDKTTDTERLYHSEQEYQKYKKTNFKVNVKNLIDALAKKEDHAIFDHIAATNDAIRFPRQQVTSRGYPFWDTSEASAWLKQDVKNGVHETMTMDDFITSRDAYLAFPQEIFLKHVYQETNSRMKKSYWIKNNDNKKKK
jgi:hypothetical protein